MDIKRKFDDYFEKVVTWEQVILFLIYCSFKFGLYIVAIVTGFVEIAELIKELA